MGYDINLLYKIENKTGSGLKVKRLSLTHTPTRTSISRLQQSVFMALLGIKKEKRLTKPFHNI